MKYKMGLRREEEEETQGSEGRRLDGRPNENFATRSETQLFSCPCACVPTQGRREYPLQTHSPVLRHSVDPASKMGEKRKTHINCGVVVMITVESKSNLKLITSPECLCTGMVTKRGPRLRELAPADRGSHAAGSRNLGPLFFGHPCNN